MSPLGPNAKSLGHVYDSAPSPPKKALRGKQSAGPVDAVVRRAQWMTAWSEYVCGNVASKSSERVIQRFLLSTIASRRRSAHEVAREAGVSEEGADMPPLRAPSRKLRDMLKIAEAPVGQEDGNGLAGETAGQK